MKNYIQVIATIIVLVFMIVFTVEDISRKQIHTVRLAVFILLNFILAWSNQTDWITIVAGAILGILFLIISICTKEKIGKGDAIIIGGIGIYLGFQAALMIVFVALLMICIYGLFFVRKKNGWSCEIAFVPFLLVPYASAVILQLYNSTLSV